MEEARARTQRVHGPGEPWFYIANTDIPGDVSVPSSAVQSGSSKVPERDGVAVTGAAAGAS